MRHHRLTPEEVYAIHREYSEGVTIRVLAMENGCGAETIRRAFISLGLTTRNCGRASYEDAEWHKAYDVHDDDEYGLLIKWMLR